MISLCSFLLSLSLVTSCTSPQIKRMPIEADPSAKELLVSAQSDKSAGRVNDALKKARHLVESQGQTDVAIEAWFLIGDIYFENRAFDRSARAYLEIIESNLVTPKLSQAYIRAAMSEWYQGNMDSVVSITDRAIKQGFSADEIVPIYDVRLRALERLGKHLESLNTLVYLANNHPQKQYQERYRIAAIELVEGRLDKEQLGRIARDASFGFARPYSLYRKAELEIEEQDFASAERSFRGVIELIPDSDLAARSQEEIDRLKAIREVDPYTIGVVLPLTGRNAPVAQMSLRGIQMGLGLHEPGENRFRLAVVDSGGNPDMARRAVERLVREDNVIAIVGGLLSKTADAIASKSQELGVPDISLSQKSGVAEIGPYVFRNALTGEMQVRQLVKTAMEDLGMRRFAILYPNDAYGTEYANLFWDEVLARGGEIRGAQVYSPKETDFQAHVQRLVGTFYVEDRADEYKLRLKQWQSNQTRRSARTQPPEDLLPPIVDFDAIFIPDGARAVGQIAPMLLYNNVKGTRLLGTNLWNTPELLRRGKGYVNDAVFVDSVVSSDPRFQNSDFVRQYRSLFNEDPSIFEIQGYDSGLLLRQLLAGGVRTRTDLARGLSRVRGLPGAISPLTVESNGEIQRPLISLSIKGNQIVPFEKSVLK